MPPFIIIIETAGQGSAEQAQAGVFRIEIASMWEICHAFLLKLQVKAVLHRLKLEWQGSAYELLSHNCCEWVNGI